MDSGFTLAACPGMTKERTEMATFVVAHGAWSAGWAWKKMRPLMRAAGHELWTPTYTGLGERVHLASADVGLDTHIQDIVAVLETEDLQRRDPDRPLVRRDGRDRRRRPRAALASSTSSISTRSRRRTASRCSTLSRRKRARR